MNIEDIRKEYGEDIYAYRQEFAGARMEKDGYSDEYVHFLEQKLTSDNSDYAVPASPAPKLPSADEIINYQPCLGTVNVNAVLAVIKVLGNFA